LFLLIVHIFAAYSSDVPGGMVLVGNKVDEEERVISEEEAFDLAQKLKIPYIETSAKTAHNVVTPFSACIIDIFNKWGGIPKTLNVKRAKS